MHLPTLDLEGTRALLLTGAAGWAALFVTADTLRLPRKLFGIAKIVTTLLIGCVLLVPSTAEPGRLAAIALGIVLGTIGDAFLLEPKRFFVAGLASFLVGHVAYIVGFWSPRWSLLPLVLVLGGGGALVAALRAKLGSMVAPVAVYMLVISVMAWKAWNWSLFAGVGATFFVVSDALIAIDKFAAPVPARSFLINSTYWIAQALIVLAASGVG
ncbi:MAG: lysoplasmalogenase [Deltaproteobacteria bacterium]|nr:lysoplasmalogenase [Deltaproteobacteria bacterium]